MTPTGQLILSIYSLVAVIILITISIKKIVKEETEGWELILLIPMLIFLANVI